MGGFKKGLVLMKFSTDIVGGSEKVQKCADVMYGRVQTSQGQPSAYDLISESMYVGNDSVVNFRKCLVFYCKL